MNGVFPHHVFYWRDGVSLQQLETVLKEEVDCESGFRGALRDLGISNKCKLNVVIVQKRHNIKIFAKHKQDYVNKQTEDCPAGLYIDEVITNAEDRIEYIVKSHHACKGTARPTKYIVTKNESGLNMANWAEATLALCAMHQTAMKTVSLPSIVYAAHKACERARNWKGPIDQYENCKNF